MTDWNDPSTSQTHSNELAATKGRDESNAIMDYSADSNIPDGTIRWNDSANRFEKWDATGGSWGELTATYSITVTDANDSDTVDGFNAGNSSGQVPVSNGTKNNNLNADFLDGQHGSYYDDAPNGTTMLFYQASAPTGWTQDTSVNDRVLRVVSGSGGGSGGSWTISGLNVQGHILTEAEMPSHNHGNGSLSADNNGSHNHGNSTGNAGGHSHSVQLASQTGDSDVDTALWGDTSNAGSIDLSVGNHNHHIPTDGDHGHNISGSTANAGSGDPHDHGIDHDGNWRPSHIDVIAATRSK